MARALFGVTVLGYLGLTAVALAHSYLEATPQERRESGLRFIVLGLITGLGPSTMSGIPRFSVPGLVLPGRKFYVLFVVLTPISLALATTRVRAAPPAASA